MNDSRFVFDKKRFRHSLKISFNFQKIQRRRKRDIENEKKSGQEEGKLDRFGIVEEINDEKRTG